MPDSEEIFGDRMLVVAFEGWNDAGEAASAAVDSLRESLGLRPVFEVDAEEYFDFQFNRPTIALDEHGQRSLSWPGVTLYGPDAGEPLYVLLGAEPSRNWQSFIAEMLEAIEDREITGVIFLGAMLADVPHTRPISVFVSSDNPGVREAFDIGRSSYEGPVGILTVLAMACETVGIPTASIWASVPHYVHSVPSPKATLALLEKLEDVTGIDVPRGDLPVEAVAWETGIDALAGEDEDMAAYIAGLEQARDTVDSPEASGDAIAEEFEKYLRRRGDNGRPDTPYGR